MLTVGSWVIGGRDGRIFVQSLLKASTFVVAEKTLKV